MAKRRNRVQTSETPGLGYEAELWRMADALLPKLISGQLRVKDAERFLKERGAVMRYDPNKYHRRSIRLKGYDYTQAGVYFVTICTQNRECLFGNITDAGMVLNDGGKAAERCWNEISRPIFRMWNWTHLW